MSASPNAPPSHKPLLFAPFSSLVSPTFWGKFDEVKVEVLQLNEDPVPIWGFYAPHDIPEKNPMLSVDNMSFDGNCKYFGVKVPGILKTTITVEHFKSLDYNELMKEFGGTLLKDLFTEEGRDRIAKNPAVLGSFCLLLYADLKKYKFIFWFGFPAINLPSFETCGVGNVLKAEDHLGKSYTELSKQLQGVVEVSFFIVWKQVDGKLELKRLQDIDAINVSSLENVWFGYLDTSSVEGTPSWVLRNYLVFIKLKLKLPAETEINVFSYRPGRSGDKDSSCCFRILYKSRGGDAIDSLETAKFIGWERNDKDKFGPKQVDTQMSMDPVKLAENSVDFNLKLMKWRLFPELDLKMMHRTKCLIIGAGTLGCNIARCLMGWGIRHITFVDNGNVSYSNPVRQSLYCFEDCVQGGKVKAEAAAQNVAKIFPGMRSQGVKLMVPMPGHPLGDGTRDQVKHDYGLIEKLVQDCDVMFLLMDTRESRWLPTVLGAKYEKIVINAALGFDSYVVMRHGMLDPATNKRNLGCYFCTDVVAPGDSTKDRTLDQQCTVTRPGISMIAGGLAVELMTSVLHHPKKGLASGNPSEDDASPLGFLPHSIRGFIGSGEQISPCFQAYDKCTACSEKVLTELDKRGFDFISDVLNNSSDYLEKLTGLDKLKDVLEMTDEIIALSDDDDCNDEII